MYDELVKRLRDDEAWKNCDFDFIYGWMHESADAIEEIQGKYFLMKKTAEWLAEKVPRWIPVTEEPPLKVGDDGYNGYLVYANGYYEVADYTTDEFDNVPYFHVDGEYEPNVRYFMPLPEPPKEET